MSEVATMNIYQRLNEVKKAIGYVQKDDKKIDGMYKAVTHDAVTAETRKHFVDNGVLVVPLELSSSVVDSGMVTGKGNPIIRFEAKYRIDFVNIDAPEERVSVEMTAHALDQGDKAPGKAHSYATKYAVLKVLQLETGEDEEGREATKPKKYADIALPAAPITPTTGAWEAMSAQQQSRLTDLSNVAKEAIENSEPDEALRLMDDAGLDTDEKIAIWTKFNAKQRSAMKKVG